LSHSVFLVFSCNKQYQEHPLSARFHLAPHLLVVTKATCSRSRWIIL
jgi:hypothetical protein